MAMLAFIIGALFGAAGLFLLGRFTAAITGGDVQKAVLPLLGNIAAIAAGLFIPAIWLRDSLMWAGIGLAGVLVVGAVVRFAVQAYGPKSK